MLVQHENTRPAALTGGRQIFLSARLVVTFDIWRAYTVSFYGRVHEQFCLTKQMKMSEI